MHFIAVKKWRKRSGLVIYILHMLKTAIKKKAKF